MSPKRETRTKKDATNQKEFEELPPDAPSKARSHKKTPTGHPLRKGPGETPKTDWRPQETIPKDHYRLGGNREPLKAIKPLPRIGDAFDPNHKGDFAINVEELTRFGYNAIHDFVQDEAVKLKHYDNAARVVRELANLAKDASLDDGGVVSKNMRMALERATFQLEYRTRDLFRPIDEKHFAKYENKKNTEVRDTIGQRAASDFVNVSSMGTGVDPWKTGFDYRALTTEGRKCLLKTLTEQKFGTGWPQVVPVSGAIKVVLGTIPDEILYEASKMIKPLDANPCDRILSTDEAGGEEPVGIPFSNLTHKEKIEVHDYLVGLSDNADPINIKLSNNVLVSVESIPESVLNAWWPGYSGMKPEDYNRTTADGMPREIREFNTLTDEGWIEVGNFLATISSWADHEAALEGNHIIPIGKRDCVQYMHVPKDFWRKHITFDSSIKPPKPSDQFEKDLNSDKHWNADDQRNYGGPAGTPTDTGTKYK